MTSYKIKPVTSVPGVGIILVSFFFMALERLGVLAGSSTIWSIAMLLFLFIYLLREFFRFREHTISYFYQIFYFLGVIASAFLISTGAYMVEIRKVGDANGVFWTGVIFFVAGLEASRFTYYKSIRRFQVSVSPCFNKDVEKIFLLFITSAALLASLVVFVKYSGPLIIGVERSEFWSSIVPSGFSFVPSLIIQTFFLAIALYWPRGNKKSTKMAVLIIFLYLCSTAVVLGQKFSAFIIYAMIFFLYMAAHHPRFRISFKMVVWFFVTFLLIVGLVVYSYEVIGRDAGFISVRLALQSQLNWSVLNAVPFPWGVNAPLSCFMGCQFGSGADYISYKFLPETVYRHYTEAGTGLSGFLPALPILIFGFPVALALHVVFSMFTGKLQAYLVSQIRKRNTIYSFLVFKIYFSLVLFWYAAIHYAVYSKLFIFSLLLCLMLLVLFYVSNARDRYRPA